MTAEYWVGRVVAARVVPWYRSAMPEVRRGARPLLAQLARFVGRQPVDLAAKRWAVRKLFPYVENREREFDVRLFGYRYRGNLGSLIDSHIFYYGVYEPDVLLTLRHIARYQRRSGCDVCLYDIGANVGQHALSMTRHAGTIYAFEPLPALWGKLRATVRDNAIANIDVIPFGLGDAEGAFDYHPPRDGNHGAGSFIKDHYPTNRSASIRLPMVRGDTFVANMGLRPPSLIKLDVEGAEASVLRGLSDTIQRHRPAIVCELSPTGKRLFGSEAGLRRHFYAQHEIRTIERTKFPTGFRLASFRFDATENFLIVPCEHRRILEIGCRNLLDAIVLNRR